MRIKKIRLCLFFILCLLLTSCVQELPSANTIDNIKGDLEIHFLDVGQADSILVIFGDRKLLIDGGNVADSSFIYSYLESMGIKHLDYIIGTHPHEDHIGGLAAALQLCPVDHIYCSLSEYDSDAFKNFKTYAEKQNKNIMVPKAGDFFQLGDCQIQILAPTKSNEYVNNMSIVIKITYKETSVLLMGDAEREEELDLIESGVDLSADVLKVGHHGSDTSTSYRFLREVMPKYAVVSVGDNNTYGHPSEDVLSRFRDADVEVYRTDYHGTVMIHSNGQSITISSSKQAINKNQGDNKEKGGIGHYIGNVNTKKFHRMDCNSLPDEQNRDNCIYSREQALGEGYTPCQRCNP